MSNRTSRQQYNAFRRDESANERHGNDTVDQEDLLMKKWPHCGQCSNEMSLDKMASEYNPEAGLDDHDEMAGIAEESIEELIAMMDGSVPEDFPSKDGMSIEIMAMKPKKDEDDELF